MFKAVEVVEDGIFYGDIYTLLKVGNVEEEYSSLWYFSNTL